MPNILEEIVQHKSREVSQRKLAIPASDLERSVVVANNEFQNALADSGIKLITEIKPSSPSAGLLRAQLDVDAVLAAYNQFASAISVLTDAKYFSGSLELLEEVAAKSPHPVLCKDFILDEYQLLEARAHHAHAALLIVKILNNGELARLHKCCVDLGMTPVVEVQNAHELQRALDLQPQMVLINNRNLSTFEIEFETTAELAPQIPQSVITVSASGIERPEHIKRLLPYANRFLIGSSLMKSEHPEKLLQELICA